MSTIVLKTAKRKTTVSRTKIRNAVAAAYATTNRSSTTSAPQKKASRKAAALK